MTETIEPMMMGEDDKQALAHRLVDQAREAGVDLVGPGGLLTGLTKQVALPDIGWPISSPWATRPGIGRRLH